MRKWLFAAIIAGCAAAPANATWVTGNDLLRMCESDKMADYAVCDGYITGALDMITSMESAKVVPPGFKPAVRSSVTVSQVRLIVLNYLKSHPQMLDSSASGLVFIAVRDAFGSDAQPK
ncbi:Rap1a/Tai family immunity protein [Sphingomonas sp. HITSZ_GF]|uniref:Rap1a/Tai family immunity protein n=1 Tax=Sphingomonas sp. HITSZ_GF TaxID=3037247 RepID=UPI00240DF4D4|nr:Rap1a/Tai family immunity protein [Sphingomonas sp. HITSZ_GF]MDG2532093.1 Rap1a/Tai family immunity protein [Sphingomonas sp. HITSZ_GF]